MSDPRLETGRCDPESPDVKFRHPNDPLAPVAPRQPTVGLGHGLDPPVVGEPSVSFDWVVFDRVDSEQLGVP